MSSSTAGYIMLTEKEVWIMENPGRLPFLYSAYPPRDVARTTKSVLPPEIMMLFLK